MVIQALTGWLFGWNVVLYSLPATLVIAYFSILVGIEFALNEIGTRDEVETLLQAKREKLRAQRAENEGREL